MKKWAPTSVHRQRGNNTRILGERISAGMIPGLLLVEAPRSAPRATPLSRWERRRLAGPLGERSLPQVRAFGKLEWRRDGGIKSTRAKGRKGESSVSTIQCQETPYSATQNHNSRRIWQVILHNRLAIQELWKEGILAFHQRRRRLGLFSWRFGNQMAEF